MTGVALTMAELRRRCAVRHATAAAMGAAAMAATSGVAAARIGVEPHPSGDGAVVLLDGRVVAAVRERAEGWMAQNFGADCARPVASLDAGIALGRRVARLLAVDVGPQTKGERG